MSDVTPAPAPVSTPAPSATPQRPWYGTLLGVLSAIGTGLMGILSLIILILSVTGGSFLSAAVEEIPSFITGALSLVILVPMLGILALYVFITIGFFKGTRWTVIVAMVFGILGLLSALGSIRFSIAPVVINGLLLWAEVMCLKHPFYNQKTI